MSNRVSGNIIDIENRRIFKGDLVIDQGRIVSIEPNANAADQYILPGFIDAHVHIESSMIVPSEFARMAVVHGTVATVSDPHEIGNVLGVEGVHYMIRNGSQVPFKFYFGAPSCVPATPFETSGAVIDEYDVEALLQNDAIKYLAEMMNWPGVLNNDPVVLRKIALAHQYGKVVDGHAPGLRGDQAMRYAAAGIGTDHECFTAAEALDKLNFGMKVIIREGSAAKNFDALIGLLDTHSDKIMFCSDDKHPDSLEEGHINLLVKRALGKGIDLFKVLAVACINPIDHYKLDVGKLRAGDPADFIVVDDLQNFNVLQTYIGGVLVARKGTTLIHSVKAEIVNRFSARRRTAQELAVRAEGTSIRVIEALDGQLITNALTLPATVNDGFVVADTARDILKIVVLNRYSEALPAVGFIRNFGIKRGAIASSVAHDSHNIVAVGADDDSLARALNMVIESEGGVAAVDGTSGSMIPLPVAGIMSPADGYEVAGQYKAIDRVAKQLGSTLSAPFMTLSFMALLVIPSLKLSDKGLFDGDRFAFLNVFASEKKDPTGKVGS